MRAQSERGDQWKLWLALGVVAIGGLAYIATAPKIYKPCERPIEFSIGQVDPRVGVSRAVLLDDLRRAASIWNRAEGKTLLEYKETSALPVNFVYSYVQQLRDRNAPLIRAIEQNRIAAKEIEDRQTVLQQPYAGEKRELQQETESFNQGLAAYNARVDHWNSIGGAPPGEKAELDEEKSRLAQTQSGLRQRLAQFNGLVRRINALVSERNAIIMQSNGYAATINRSAGTQYVAGMYRYVKDANGNILSNWIEVYEVADTASLITMLAHELGHALGLQHNNNPNSIMARMGDVPSFDQTSADQARKPTAEDMAALNAICHPSDGQ